MRKFVLSIFYLLLGLFLVFVGGGFVLPDKAQISRHALINAPPDKIFAVISDLRRAKDWTPWFQLDPAMVVTYEGEPGVGQKMRWSSRVPEVGTGTQETSSYIPNRQVASKLDLGDLGQAVATVNLAPEGTGTRVSWQFDAALRNIIERWFGLLFDRMIGPDFEKGLANLKVYIETQP
jgi:uncharacterized protein YndB with AHSA1/START domain